MAFVLLSYMLRFMVKVYKNNRSKMDLRKDNQKFESIVYLSLLMLLCLTAVNACFESMSIISISLAMLILSTCLD